MMFRELAEKLRPPRTVAVRFPFGRPWGEPDNPSQHRVIVEHALEVLRSAQEPGTIVDLPYRWRREDYAAILERRRSGVRVS